LYSWNQTVGGKWVNELVFLVLLVVPVYEISFFIDGIILNSIEFWTGSNPVSMKKGEIEEQLVKGEDGNEYKITASQNQFAVEALTGENQGQVEAMRFLPKKQKWVLVKNDKTFDVATILDRSENGDITYSTPFNEAPQTANLNAFSTQEFALK
jgi:hypothetical protein